MANLYIEDINSNIYYFKRLPRKQAIELQKKLSKIKEEEAIEVNFEIFKEIFELSNPTYNMENFENDILEYNYQEIGLENFIKLINMVVQEVFTLKGQTPNKYAFLEEAPQE